jgi:hypothetical protein
VLCLFALCDYRTCTVASHSPNHYLHVLYVRLSTPYVQKKSKQSETHERTWDTVRSQRYLREPGGMSNSSLAVARARHGCAYYTTTCLACLLYTRRKRADTAIPFRRSCIWTKYCTVHGCMERKTHLGLWFVELLRNLTRMRESGPVCIANRIPQVHLTYHGTCILCP